MANSRIRQIPNLAYALQNLDGLFEVTNVKHRKSKFDITEMAIAIFKFSMTSLAGIVITRHAHTLIKRSMFGYWSCGIYIVDVAI